MIPLDMLFGLTPPHPVTAPDSCRRKFVSPDSLHTPRSLTRTGVNALVIDALSETEETSTGIVTAICSLSADTAIAALLRLQADGVVDLRTEGPPTRQYRFWRLSASEAGRMKRATILAAAAALQGE